MHIYAALLVAAAAVVRGQVNGDTGPDNATTPTATAGEITIHKITVGRVQNSFQPNSVQAKPGDIVQFTFYPTNHSVIRSAYGYPCVPYEDVMPQGQGFTSGPMPVNSSGILPTWNVTVNNTDPVFFYCGAPGSCFGWGMLGVINANNATDLSKQIAIAREESYETWPGQAIPAAALQSLASIAATATAISSSTSASSTFTSSPVSTAATTIASTAAAAVASSSNGVSTGAIAGIVIGIIAIVLIAAGLFFFLGRARRNKKDQAQQQQLLGQGLPAHMVQTYPAGEAGYMGGYYKSQLPPYMPASESKGPYVGQNVQYLGQDDMPSSPLQHSAHQSYVEYRSVSGSPPPSHSVRHSITSELDSQTVHAVRSAPNLSSVQEMDTLQTPRIDH